MTQTLEAQAATFCLNLIEVIHLTPARDFEQFLFDGDYMALPRSEIYPGVVQVGGEIYDGFLTNKYEAAFVQAGLGSGKSTMAELLVCAIAHWLLCLPDPHAYFGLLPDKPIVIPCMGPTAYQVKDVVFSGVRSFIAGGPFFQKLKPAPEIVEGQIESDVLKLSATFRRGEREILKILAGNSVETYPVGMNVFSAVVDELSKFRDSEGKSQAKDIFETLDQRRLSRFAETPCKGIIICIGTAGAEGDYVDRKLRQAEADPKAYVHRGVTWEMKGRHRYRGGSFHFAKLDLGPRGVQYRCCDEWPLEEAEQVTLHLADVPDVFKDVAQRDPVLFLRDFASVSSLALNPFDVNAEVVSRLANLDREHPLYEGTLEPKPWFRGEEGVDYYVHIDLALGREGGDAAGLCLAHQIGEKRVEVAKPQEGDEWAAVFEFRPVIMLDLMLRWTAGERGEILFSDIREFLYKLQEWGFDITGQPLKWDSYGKVTDFRGGVSYDGFQSADSIQILWEHGICAKVFSVDRDSGPYEDLREALHDARLDYYRYVVTMPDGLPLAIFEHEYKRLESVKGKKVDHPEGGCFVGDTRIPLLDGTCPTIAELVDRDVWVYSCKSDGEIVPGMAHGKLTKYVDTLIDVVLDSGATIRCTPEHLFLLRNGTYKAAEDIRPGIDRLMPINQQWPVNGGYERISGRCGNVGRVLTHHMVNSHFEGSIPEGCLIHHIDGNKTNNVPGNLKRVSKSRHAHSHTTRRHAEDEEYGQKVREGLQKFNLSERGRRIHARAMYKTSVSLSPEERKRMARKRAAFRSDITSERLMAIRDDPEATNANAASRILGCGRNVVIRVLKEMEFASWEDFKDAEMGQNHKVRHIIPVQLPELIPVYDLEVDKWGNFALSAGVFVHNSKDVSDGAAGVVSRISEDYGRPGGGWV